MLTRGRCTRENTAWSPLPQLIMCMSPIDPCTTSVNKWPSVSFAVKRQTFLSVHTPDYMLYYSRSRRLEFLSEFPFEEDANSYSYVGYKVYLYKKLWVSKVLGVDARSWMFYIWWQCLCILAPIKNLIQSGWFFMNNKYSVLYLAD